MDFLDKVSSSLKSAGNSLKSTAETWAVPVKLQQLYKGYALKDVSMGETRMNIDFLSMIAALADHIYLTGTRSAQSASNSAQAQSLKGQLGVLFQNFYQLSRFDALTGLAFETMGPFGAVIACATSPGSEKMPQDPKSNSRPRYRVFIVFRGTSAKVGKEIYLDDVSTDLKAGAFKIDNKVGAKAGEVARGFYSTYYSCRNRVVNQLLPGAYHYLRKIHEEQAKARSPEGLAPKTHLHESDIDYYILGHSLGGAVATLCAYDIACLQPAKHPILVTFGSPPVGNIDFAIDFNRVMVDRVRYHPRTGEMRSIRVVAQSSAGTLDVVSAVPDKLPNYIHVNTRVLLDTPATNRLMAHSMTNSYREGLKALK